MAVHETIKSHNREEKYSCETCYRKLAAHERKFYSKSTMEQTQVLCDECYRRAMRFQYFSLGFLGLLLITFVLWSIITFFKLRPDR